EGSSTLLSMALASQYVEAEQYNDALKLVRSLQKAASGDAKMQADAYYVQARAEMGLKQYREAKSTLEAALKLSPDDAECQEMMRYASAMLGEGDNSAIKEKIEPVVLPGLVAAEVLLDPGAGTMLPREVIESEDACYINRVTAISFIAGKEQRST